MNSIKKRQPLVNVKEEKRNARSCAGLAALLELRCETKNQHADRLYRI